LEADDHDEPAHRVDGTRLFHESRREVLSTVRRVGAGLRHRTVLFLEPKRAVATLGYTLLALVAVAVVVGALLYRTAAWPAEWRLRDLAPSDTRILAVAVAATVVALLFLVGAIVNGRRWHTARAVKRLSNDPALAPIFPDTRVSAPTQRSAVIPPLTVRFVAPRQFPRPRAKLRRVTRDHNVIGRPPLRIAYLRLFENQPRMRTFIQGAWREFGYVHFLRSAAAVTPAELRSAKLSGNVAGLFVASPDRLVAALDGHVERLVPKGRHKFTRIAANTIRVRDRYGSYPVRPVLCHGNFWKAAVDELLERVDLVVLDLSGYMEKNAGVRYELQRVIDRVPIERVMFLGDPYSKKRFLNRELQLAWSHMAPGSPNADHQPKTAVVAVTDYMHRTETRNEHGQVTQVNIRLVARRRQTRRVVAAAQDRLNRATGVRPAAPVTTARFPAPDPLSVAPPPAAVRDRSMIP
jgi:hypothetical protein